MTSIVVDGELCCVGLVFNISTLSFADSPAAAATVAVATVVAVIASIVSLTGL